MSNIRFSGHETFHCRHFWLKKGVDFIVEEKDFKSNSAVVDLGVGKNMVVSINHWLNAFDLINGTKNITTLAEKIFLDDGFDPYLEDFGTLWILHYKLLKNDYSSINKIVFDEFRKTRVSSEFTTNQLQDFVFRKLKKINQTVSDTTIENDIKVFLRNYITINREDKNLEDDFSSIFLSLKLISILPNVLDEGQRIYRIEHDSKVNLNPLILLFAIKDTFEDEISIAVMDIQIKVSDLFLCNREGTEDKLLKLQELGYLVYKEDAGRKEIQFKSDSSKWDILKDYYESDI
jgi:hypothetical protein